MQASRDAATNEARCVHRKLIFVSTAFDDVIDRRKQVEDADKRSGSDSR